MWHNSYIFKTICLIYFVFSLFFSILVLYIAAFMNQIELGKKYYHIGCFCSWVVCNPFQKMMLFICLLLEYKLLFWLAIASEVPYNLLLSPVECTNHSSLPCPWRDVGSLPVLFQSLWNISKFTGQQEVHYFTAFIRVTTFSWPRLVQGPTMKSNPSRHSPATTCSVGSCYVVWLNTTEHRTHHRDWQRQPSSSYMFCLWERQ